MIEIVEREKAVAITALFAHKKVGIVERQKAVGITPLLPYNKDHDWASARTAPG